MDTRGGARAATHSGKIKVEKFVWHGQWVHTKTLIFRFFQYKNQINKEGFFVVKSDLTRYQHMNLADALERIRNIVRTLEVEVTPKEVSFEKLAVIQRRHEKAARERLFVKRNRSQTKSDRLVG